MRPSLLLAFILAGPATAQTPSLQGDWLGFSLTANVAAVMGPVFEHLQIDGDRVVERGWTISAEHSACGTPRFDMACTLPAPLGEARLTRTGRWIDVAPVGPDDSPFLDRVAIEAWPEVALAGHRWHVAGDARRMVMARPWQIGEAEVPMLRLYYRAPARAAGDLFLYLRLIESRYAHAMCGIIALSEDPVLWDAFFAALADMGEVLEEVERIERIPREGRAPEVWSRRMTLLRDPELMGDHATDVSDLTETGRAMVLAQQRLAREQPRDETLLRTLLWPAPEAIRQHEASCLESIFRY